MADEQSIEEMAAEERELHERSKLGELEHDAPAAPGSPRSSASRTAWTRRGRRSTPRSEPSTTASPSWTS